MLRAEGLGLRLGGTLVLDHLDLEVDDGEVLAVLGPSGSGKTTLLRAVAGLQAVDVGRLYWDGRPLERVPPHRRGFGLMFQDLALFPHKSVRGNVAFGLRMAGLSASETERRVREALGWVGLPGYEERAVAGLSGGEQQRVALARSLAPRPRLLMLDEPLGSLDRALRDRLVPELGEILRARGTTALYVTHDHEEAFALADRLVLLRQGRVVQAGTPGEVWRRPAGEWAARFLGLRNVFEVEVGSGRADAGWGSFAVVTDRAAGSRKVVLRPTAFEILPPNDGAGGRPTAPAGSAPLLGRVVRRSFRGGHYLLFVEVEGGPLLEVETPTPEAPSVGERVRLRVRPEQVLVLQDESWEGGLPPV
jgi:thiamine transport system ATP-binding protein